MHNEPDSNGQLNTCLNHTFIRKGSQPKIYGRMAALNLNQESQLPPCRRWTITISGQQRLPREAVFDLPCNLKFAHWRGVYLIAEIRDIRSEERRVGKE